MPCRQGSKREYRLPHPVSDVHFQESGTHVTDVDYLGGRQVETGVDFCDLAISRRGQFVASNVFHAQGTEARTSSVSLANQRSTIICERAENAEKINKCDGSRQRLEKKSETHGVARRLSL